MIQLSKNQRSKNMSLTNDGEEIKLTMPRCSMPFGFSVKNYNGNDSINLVASVNPVFADNYRAIEREIIEELSNQSEDIFYKKMTVDEIYEIFSSNISDGDILRVKYTNDSRLYDSNSKPSGLTIIDGCCSTWDVTCNFFITGVYFMNRKVGLIVKAHHVKIFEPKETGFMFLDRDD